MLFRLVRPVKRSGSRNHYFVRRIPRDVFPRAVGMKLFVQVGSQTRTVRISPRTKSIRVSLGTSDPLAVKARQARVDAYLENVWQGLRQNAPVSLSHRNANALAGELYRAWADGDDREDTIGIEYDPDTKTWRRLERAEIEPEEWAALGRSLDNPDDDPTSYVHKDVDDLTRWEQSFGPIIDRLLLAKGISKVDQPSREILVTAFYKAMRDAAESRKRNAEGDYSPDEKAKRFPEWRPAGNSSSSSTVPLKGLFEAWWVEAKATGRKPSTYESYKNTVTAFVAFLGHDDAARVTIADVVRFKDHRLASINPRTGKAVSAKTVKDSDLSGLKTVFGWAKVNGKLPANPAEGVTIKLGKQRRVRSKGFTDSEAVAILRAALNLKPGKEQPETLAAKRWVPWLVLGMWMAPHPPPLSGHASHSLGGPKW